MLSLSRPLLQPDAKGIPMKLKVVLLLCLFLALSLTLPSPSITQSRDPDKVYKVAILPFTIHSQENLDYLREGINDILTSRITVEERVVVMERSIVERALYEEKPMRLDETAAAKIGMRIGADYIVLGSITKVGDYISLDARLISITEEKPPVTVYTQQKGIDDVMIKIGDFAQDIGYKILGRRTMAGRPGESRHLPRGARGGIERLNRGSVDYKKSQSFDFKIKGLDVGDVDGDKKNEIVIMDDHNLYIFKYDGDKLTLFRKIEQGNEHNFLTLDVVDLNRNGHAEIIVTSVVEDDVRSFLLEYEEGRFKKITEKSNWFFRVLVHPKEGPILLGQRRGSDGFPVDPVYRMVWKKKSFEKGPKMDFPPGTNIYGVAMADIRGEGKPQIIALDRFDRLNVISEDGKTMWKSIDRFGGTDIFYDTKKKWRDDYKDGSPYRVYIPGRILVKDLYGDGIPQIIINKNELTTRIFEKARSFESGEIYCLIWDESDLVTDWKTRTLRDYIADFQVKDVDNDGNEDLVFAVVGSKETGEGDSGLFSNKIVSNIYFFKLF
ncbi:MAG: integrin-like repeat protein [Deltaproteobacteria bacterium]|nr:integrin-like repeat protein [Deltaproteobacteria bacterium]